MRILYAESKPNREHLFNVQTHELETYRSEALPEWDEQEHRLHVAEYGNPNGIPALVIHGGPGAGCSPSYSRYLNPDKYCIYVHDQRGCGKSHPKFSLHDNTTQHLVDDIENLRKAIVGDDKPIVLFGGSWGSTLPLVYAEQYPEKVAALILRGIWLGTFDNLGWLDSQEAAEKRPMEYKIFLQGAFPNLPDQDCVYGAKSYDDIMTAYGERIKDPSIEVRKAAGMAFAIWESANAYTDDALIAEEIEWAKTEEGMNMGIIEIHYMVNKAFLAPNQIINNIGAIKDKRVHIVQGKHDIVCPPSDAQALYAALGGDDNDKVTMVMTEAGHSGEEPENISELVKATDDLASTLLQQQSSPSSAGLLGTTQAGARQRAEEAAAAAAASDAAAKGEAANTSTLG